MGVFLTGDIHGQAHEVWFRLLDNDGEMLVREGDTLVCLGDVGLLYGDYLMGDLRRVLSRLPCDVVVMRGNHDARYCRDMRSGLFAGKRGRERDWCGGRVMYDEKYPNILYVPDEGGLFELDGMRCLLVPGAFSADGEWRRQNDYPFEPDEQLTQPEMDALMNVARCDRVDYVLSHTCPLSWEPHFRDLFLPGIDQSKVDRTMERWMDELLEATALTLRGWYFGHFHHDRTIPAAVPARMLFRDVLSLGWGSGSGATPCAGSSR